MPTPQDREKLFQIDRQLQEAGMAPLTPQELQKLYQQMQQQGVTNPMQMFAEGGLIADRSGQGTQRIRSQSGMP